MAPEQPPPNDEAAERIVLAGLLRLWAVVGDEVRRTGLRGDDLYLDLHRRVWGAIAGLAYRGERVTVWAVWQWLTPEWGEWPRVGLQNPAMSCAAWLLDLMDDDPTGYWAMEKATRVRELAQRRRRMHELRRQLRELEAGSPLELVAV